MGSEVNDEILSKAFSHYSSFVKGKMVKNKQTNKNKGASYQHPFYMISFLGLSSNACVLEGGSLKATEVFTAGRVLSPGFNIEGVNDVCEFREVFI